MNISNNIFKCVIVVTPSVKEKKSQRTIELTNTRLQQKCNN